jgi:hypothetical protein
MILKPLLKAALTLSILGFMVPASAHTLSNKTLRVGFGAQATDVWQVACSADALLGNSDHLVAQVWDKSADTNILSLVMAKGTAAATTVDAVGGDSILSPAIKVVGGNGIYTLYINHTLSGNQVYNIEFHCQNANGDHTPTTTPSTPVQDN